MTSDAMVNAMDDAVANYERDREERLRMDEQLAEAVANERASRDTLYGLLESLEPLTGKKSVQRDGYTYYCNPRLVTNADEQFIELADRCGFTDRFTRRTVDKKALNSFVRSALNGDGDVDEEQAELLNMIEPMKKCAGSIAIANAEGEGQILPGLSHFFTTVIGRRKASE